MYAQASTEITTKSSLISDLAQAGLAVQLILLALIGMSIFSWAIILKKKKQVEALDEANSKFLDLFWSSGTLDQVQNKSGHHSESSLSRVFQTGYKELEKVHRLPTQNSDVISFGMQNLESALRKGQDREIKLLEKKLNFLATTGSTAPFIGLLGTVVGIMNSFRDISDAGSASLATVAPGISEALFATAIGLLAAIPAVMAYNFLLGKVIEQESVMDNFISELTNLARLEFIKKS